MWLGSLDNTRWKVTDFNCTSCGLCCKNLRNALIWDAPEFLRPAIAAFPYKVMPDGSCEKMVGNQCSVYEDRPLLCNIDKTHDELDVPMSKQEWFDLNEKGCDQLQLTARNNLKMEIRQWLGPQ